MAALALVVKLINTLRSVSGISSLAVEMTDLSQTGRIYQDPVYVHKMVRALNMEFKTDVVRENLRFKHFESLLYRLYGLRGNYRYIQQPGVKF